MIFYFERESAVQRRDWLQRLAASPDPSAVVFREQAARLTREINELDARKEHDALQS